MSTTALKCPDRRAHVDLRRHYVRESRQVQRPTFIGNDTTEPCAPFVFHCRLYPCILEDVHAGHAGPYLLAIEALAPDEFARRQLL